MASHTCFSNLDNVNAIDNGGPDSEVPEEQRCTYKSTRCNKRRAHKDDGSLHKMCEEHRNRANASQRKTQRTRREREAEERRREDRRREIEQQQRQERRDQFRQRRLREEELQAEQASIELQLQIQRMHQMQMQSLLQMQPPPILAPHPLPITDAPNPGESPEMLEPLVGPLPSPLLIEELEILRLLLESPDEQRPEFPD